MFAEQNLAPTEALHVTQNEVDPTSLSVLGTSWLEQQNLTPTVALSAIPNTVDISDTYTSSSSLTVLGTSWLEQQNLTPTEVLPAIPNTVDISDNYTNSSSLSVLSNVASFFQQHRPVATDLGSKTSPAPDEDSSRCSNK